MAEIISKLLVGAGLLGSVAVASAQDVSRLERPWKVELGVFSPNTNISGLDEKVGATLAVGYNIARYKKAFDLDIEVRGTGYQLDGFGDTADVSIGQWLLNLTYHPEGEKYFAGFGIGAGRGDIKINNVTFNDTDTDFVWQATLGYDFKPTVYGVARIHGGDYAGYRGYSVSVGYRF